MDRFAALHDLRTPRPGAGSAPVQINPYQAMTTACIVRGVSRSHCLRGRSRQILTHWEVEDDGRQKEDLGTEVRGALREELGGGVVATRAVLAGEACPPLAG